MAREIGLPAAIRLSVAEEYAGGRERASNLEDSLEALFGALYLDTRNRHLGERELYRGALNRATVEPRRVLREGLLLGAAGCIVFHTHPSGDPSPSAEDLAFTRKLAEAGDAVGIRLVDIWFWVPSGDGSRPAARLVRSRETGAGAHPAVQFRRPRGGPRAPHRLFTALSCSLCCSSLLPARGRRQWGERRRPAATDDLGNYHRR
jgi:hypothetical protein